MPTAWRLEREADLNPLPAASWCPTFAWSIPTAAVACSKSSAIGAPNISKKFAQMRLAGRADVILAVLERLKLERAGITRDNLPVRVVWFKDHVLPQVVLDVLEG
jgi:predicted nuclease of restriction endonuclease-like RecB superfamily